MHVTIEINKEEAEKLKKHLEKRMLMVASGMDSVQLADAMLSRIITQVEACKKAKGET